MNTSNKDLYALIIDIEHTCPGMLTATNIRSHKENMYHIVCTSHSRDFNYIVESLKSTKLDISKLMVAKINLKDNLNIGEILDKNTFSK